MSKEPTINEGIEKIATDEMNRQRPLPIKVTITAIHNNGYIDITTRNGDVIKNIEYIGTPVVGNKALLILIENQEQIVIT